MFPLILAYIYIHHIKMTIKWCSLILQSIEFLEKIKININNEFFSKVDIVLLNLLAQSLIILDKPVIIYPNPMTVLPGKFWIEEQCLAVIVYNLLKSPLGGFFILLSRWYQIFLGLITQMWVHCILKYPLDWFFCRLNLFRIPLQPSRIALSSTLLLISQMWISMVYGNWFKMENH